MDDDDRFYGDVAILVEAARLNPLFAAKVEEAGTDERIDELVVEGRQIIDDATSYDF